MKFFFALCCFISMTVFPAALSAAEWFTDFEAAKAESAKTKRPIFILFTNSESAGCLGFDRAIFNAKKFQDYADKNLVLMKVDFPTTSDRQSKALVKQNRELRTKFGAAIPSAYLLNEDGELYVDFVQKDLSTEEHRRKINRIMDYDPPKSYTDYIDPHVKSYKPPKKADAQPEAKKPAPKKNDAKPAKKPAKKADEKPAPKEADVGETIPDENGGTPLIPINPEGDIQEWLKSKAADEAAEQAAETEEIKEAFEAEKAAVKEEEAKEEAVAKEEDAKEEAPAEIPADTKEEDAKEE